MRIRIVLTTISLTFFSLAMAQVSWAQSKQSRNASEYDQAARMGMYYAVMCELSRADGQTAQAKTYAEKAVSLLENPTDDFEFYAKGVAYEELKRYDLALVNFDKAIQYDPQKIIAYIRRGRVYFLRGNFERALADFDKAIVLEAGKSDDAAPNKEENVRPTPDIQEAMQRDPRPWFDDSKPGAAYVDRGKIYIQKDILDLAIADFTKAIQLDPESANAYNFRGVAYSSKGDLEQAIADFDRAIELNPQLRNAHYNRGLAISRKGDEARASADFEKEKQLYPVNKSIEGGVVNGRAVKLVKPQYPDEAKRARASGLVVVHVLIDEKGKVIAADAISGHALLRDVCVEAAKNSLFTPTVLAGTPVRVTGVIHYNFFR